MKLICFDFDNVIVDGNFLMTAVQMLDNVVKEAEFTMDILRGTRDPDYFEVFVRKAISLLKGFDAKKVRGLIDVLKPMPGIKETLQALKKKGYYIIIISTNDERLIKGFLRKYKMDTYFEEIYGVKLGIHNGKLTGSVSGNVLPHEKLDTLKAIVKKHRTDPEDIIYVGDGLTDLPVLKAVGCGIVFCPDTLTKMSIFKDSEFIEKINKRKLLIIEQKDMQQVLQFVK
ncbi:MAG: HAD family phosphatase [Candidatus Aenigmatarchaeota archaeon]